MNDIVEIPYSLRQIELEMKRRELEGCFFKYAKFVFEEIYDKKMEINWHHLAYIDILMRVFNGELTRVLINTPPRYHKTEFFVILFISWCYLKNDKCNFFHTSYSDDLVHRNSKEIMDIIAHPKYQELWPLKFNKREYNKGLWSLDNGGSMRSVSSGGGTTGFGAGIIGAIEFSGCLIVDDPLKADDKDSEVARKSVNENFDNVLCSRLNDDDTPIIIVMQRLHEDDLSGHILSGKSIAGDFVHFSFPSISESGHDNPYDKRVDGVPLWKEKHGIEKLRRMEEVNPIYFAGQMQQRPAPLEGSMIKRDYLKFYTTRPVEFDYGEILTVDLNAQSETKKDSKGSNACLARYGINPGAIYLLDQETGKWGFADAFKRLASFAAKGKYTALLIEAKANGQAMISMFNEAGYHGVVPVKVHKDKQYRLNEVIPLYQAGNVYYPDSNIASWVNAHIHEMLTFPAGKNDDRVDAETQLLKYYLLNFSGHGGNETGLPFEWL